MVLLSSYVSLIAYSVLVILQPAKDVCID